MSATPKKPANVFEDPIAECEKIIQRATKVRNHLRLQSQMIKTFPKDAVTPIEARATELGKLLTNVSDSLDTPEAGNSR